MRRKNRSSIKQERLPVGAPSYCLEAQRMLVRHIIAFALHCSAMADRMSALLRKSDNATMIKNQFDYWTNAVSICRDLVSHISDRQRHLTELDDKYIYEVLELWGMKQRSLFAPAPCLPADAITDPNWQAKLAGLEHANLQFVNSEIGRSTQ